MENKEIIVFQHDERWASTKFKKYIQRKVFKTKKFSSEFEIEKIQKVYVPFYKFETNNNIHAFIEFWSHGPNDSDEYYYERILDVKLENIINGGKDLNDKYISNVLPYNLTKLVDSNSINIDSERIVDIKDISYVKHSNINDVSENMKKIAIKSCPVFLSEYHTATSKCTTEYLNEKIIYLPLWIIEVKTSDNTYEFYLNDQTGKIAGDVPVNEFNNCKQLVKICIGISLLFVLLTYLSVKFKSDIILYAFGMGITLLVLFLIYVGITSRYYMKYKISNAKVISKKYLKKKRYWITELYQKAKKEFEKEKDVN